MSFTFPDGITRAVNGSKVVYGGLPYTHETKVAEKPFQVYELIETARLPLLELHSQVEPDEPVYVDRRHIIAVTPLWYEIEAITPERQAEIDAATPENPVHLTLNETRVLTKSDKHRFQEAVRAGRFTVDAQPGSIAKLMIKLQRDGLTETEIAEHLGLQEATVVRLLAQTR